MELVRKRFTKMLPKGKQMIQINIELRVLFYANYAQTYVMSDTLMKDNRPSPYLLTLSELQKNQECLPAYCPFSMWNDNVTRAYQQRNWMLVLWYISTFAAWCDINGSAFPTNSPSLRFPLQMPLCILLNPPFISLPPIPFLTSLQLKYFLASGI